MKKLCKHATTLNNSDGQSFVEYLLACAIALILLTFTMRTLAGSPAWQRMRSLVINSIGAEFTYGDPRVANTSGDTSGEDRLHPEAGGRFFGPLRSN